MPIPWFFLELNAKLGQLDRKLDRIDKQQHMLLQQGVDTLRAIKELSDALVGTVDHAVIAISKLPQGAKMATQGLVLPIDESVELTVLTFDKNGSPTTPKNPPVLTVSDEKVLALAADADGVGVDLSAVDGVKAGNSAMVSAVVDGITAGGWQLADGTFAGQGPLPVVLAPGAVASAVISVGAPK